MSFTAIVENGTVKMPVTVPDGTSVRITLVQSLEESDSEMKDWPVPPPAVSREEIRRIQREIDAEFSRIES